MAAEGHSVQLACTTLSVSESGYYARRSRPPSRRAVRHAWLIAGKGDLEHPCMG
jgi:hypothetical protein